MTPDRCGRVLAATGDALVLLADGEARRFAAVDGARCRPGDLVRLTGDPPRVEVLWSHPSGEFPAPTSDAFRLRDHWARLRRRAELVDATRAFFRGEGFLEVDTPLVVPSPGTETHLAPVPALLTPRPGAQPEQRWLITSPEYHLKRLLSAGAPPLFQICKVFRDAERGAHHRPEFTMIEWYRPFAGFEALLDDCERWLLALNGGRAALPFQGHRLDLTPPRPRLRFRDALRQLGGVADPDALSPEAQLEVIVDRVEPQLGRQRPTFLTHFPIALASLARPAPDDPGASERFELFAGGLELGNGFGELTDAAEQRRRCQADNAERRALGLPELPLDEAFLSALAEGMPPSAGIAVGLDRVVMLLTDAASIDEVVAF